MSIPQPQKDEQGKIVGDFYPLQRAELIALRKNKLINNAAYVHLALRFENPFCDRPIEIFPKEFAMRWQMPESSVYEAIGKLKDEKVIEIKYGKVIIQWTNSQESVIVDSQEGNVSGNPESAQPIRMDSGFPESGLDSQKAVWNPRINSEISEKGIYKDRARAQTISDLTDLDQTGNTAAPPAPTAEPVEVEVLEQPEERSAHRELPHEETHQEQPCMIESKDLVCPSETEASDGEDFSAAANAEILRDIERIAHNWRLRPWMADASKFKPEMVKAVWQCNPVYYSFEGTKTPNQAHIIKALKLRDNQLKSLDLAAINAYHELHQWWSSAQALANPHVQHAFVAAAAQSKEQVEEMERQRQAQLDAERLRKDLGL